MIIPTYNKIERLLLTLTSFCYQTIDPDFFEVIIVDDGSTDETEKKIHDFKTPFSFIYIKQPNKGRSAARNRGIEKANSNIIIFCDDDLLVVPQFVEAHIKAHEQMPGPVHGTIYNLPFLKFFKDPSTGETYEQFDGSSLQEIKKYCINQERIKDISFLHRQSRMTFLEKNIKQIFLRNLTDYQWLGFTGANVSCERDILIYIGMFQEGFGTHWGAEDFELGYRLYKKKVPFRYLEEGANYHMMHVRMNYKEAVKKSNATFYHLHPDKKIYYLPKLLLKEVKGINDYVTYINSHKYVKVKENEYGKKRDV